MDQEYILQIHDLRTLKDQHLFSECWRFVKTRKFWGIDRFKRLIWLAQTTLLANTYRGNINLTSYW